MIGARSTTSATTACVRTALHCKQTRVNMAGIKNGFRTSKAISLAQFRTKTEMQSLQARR